MNRAGWRIFITNHVNLWSGRVEMPAQLHQARQPSGMIRMDVGKEYRVWFPNRHTDFRRLLRRFAPGVELQQDVPATRRVISVGDQCP